MSSSLERMNYYKPTREEAERGILYLKAALMFAQLGDNDIGCEIHIGQIKVGISDNKRIIPIIEAEIQEIEKFLDGKENTWE